ncbi:MAG: NAD(P)H-hydrate dehydratase [Planctomycetota bacterium]
MSLPDAIIPAADVALVDAAAEAAGCHTAELMQRAGAAVAEAVQRRHPYGRVLVACGAGNNGGDGYVAARLLAEAGREVSCWPIKLPKSPLCRDTAAALPERVVRLAQAPEQTPAVIVDAILGAGASGPLRGAVAPAMTRLVELQAPCIAIDMPTGWDSGAWLRPCHCVCLGLAKSELLEHPDDFSMEVADIGLPADSWQVVHPSCLRRLPRHGAGSHKGQNGRVLVVAGWRFAGALELSSLAALRSGCDLVHAWIPPGMPPLPADIVRHVSTEPHELAALCQQVDAILVGPGLGQEPMAVQAAASVWHLSRDRHLPLILDADGLHLLKDRILDQDHPRLLLTPHRGEARALLQDQADDDQLHAWARPERVILRKGQQDLISDGRQWQRNERGNPRMAVGGSGDVLAGLCAGLVARAAVASMRPASPRSGPAPAPTGVGRNRGPAIWPAISSERFPRASISSVRKAGWTGRRPPESPASA